jgi:hypothetical protein
MFNRQIPRPTYASVAATVALCMAAGGGAYAAASSGVGGVHGCYRAHGGALRVEPAGSKCARAERSVALDRVGPRGLTGPAGPAGAPGPKGDAGPAGAPGARGDAGPQGTKGLTGPIGPVGPAGPVGPVGAPGAAGPKGDTGSKGDTGPKGDIGAKGATGPQGPTGATGLKGDAGTPGAKGATGPQGPAGTPGVSGYEVVSESTAKDSRPVKDWAAHCPAGKTVLGGGVLTIASNSDDPIAADQSYPSAAGAGDDTWFVDARDSATHPDSWSLTVYAICAYAG